MHGELTINSYLGQWGISHGARLVAIYGAFCYLSLRPGTTFGLVESLVNIGWKDPATWHETLGSISKWV